MVAGARAGQHGFPSQQCGHALGEFLAASPVAAQQGDGKTPLSVGHHHGGVAGFALQQGCDQPRYRTAGTDRHKGAAAGPFALQEPL